MRWSSRTGLVAAAAMAVATRGQAQRVERDLAYGADPLQRLDLSTPPAKGFATVVFVHGGSLESGDKADSDYGKVCEPFLGAGIACATINYRLAPAHRWPDPVEDVAAAVAWVWDNIGARGGDPGRLFLLGHSSGAMLVALAGADSALRRRHRLPAGAIRGVMPMGSIMFDVELEKAIVKYGRPRVEEAFRKDKDNERYGGLDGYLAHWPIRHVRAGLPPFLFLIAEEEQEHPPVLLTNRKFMDDARALGNTADYRVLAGRDHYSAVRNLHQPGDPVFAAIREFVERIPR